MKYQFSWLLCYLLFFSANAHASVSQLIDGAAVWEDENGVKHRLADWKDQPLVLTMVYADCKKTCPMITAEKLRETHQLFEAKGVHAQYIIVTMDPESDTPKVLSLLRKKWKMTEDNWHFLRGSESASHNFALALGMRNYWSMDDHIVHNFKIVYFDPKTKKDHYLDFKQRNVASLLESE